MPSVSARLLFARIKASNPKKSISTDEDILAIAKAENNAQDDVKPPSNLFKNYETQHKPAIGTSWGGYIFKKSGNEVLLIYLHGSAFIANPTKDQWRFVKTLLETCPRCDVAFPLYAKAPAYTFNDTLEPLVDFYKEQGETYGFDNVALIGESSGGALALSTVMMARERAIPQPRSIILLYPFLDLSVTNKDISAELQEQDFCLTKRLLELGGKWWAGCGAAISSSSGECASTDSDWRVSPMYGSCERLATITIFYGTRDILCPDVDRFCRQAAVKGWNVNGHKFEGMIHDFVTMPLLWEAKQVLKQFPVLLGLRRS